jgi:predicted nucleotidyltransferase
MVDPAIVTAVQIYLSALRAHGIDVRFGIVFGSWAQGRANVWSDIDLIVVSSRFDQPRDRREIDMLWRLAARCDSRIEPVPCGERQWVEDDSSAIIEIARRDGKRIDLPEEPQPARESDR